MYIITYHKSVEKFLDKHPDLLGNFEKALLLLSQNPFPGNDNPLDTETYKEG